MKTIVFLGTHKSDSSREAIKAAEQLETNLSNYYLQKTYLCSLSNR